MNRRQYIRELNASARNLQRAYEEGDPDDIARAEQFDRELQNVSLDNLTDSE